MYIERAKQRVKSSPWLMRVAVPIRRRYLTSMSRRPLGGPIPSFEGDTRLVPVRLRSYAEYTVWRATAEAELARREAVEALLFQSGTSSGSISGTCALCGAPTSFGYTNAFTVPAPDGRQIPNVREMLFCAHCGMRNRIRGALHLFVQELRPGTDSAIYLTEQFGTTYRWLRGRFPRTQGSEYLPGRPLGGVFGGIRNEDLCALSWPDRTFDYVLSFDVMEHVADAAPAFASLGRCLRAGGRLLFTAPFSVEMASTLIRARFEPDGTITHFCEPEYHGNPTDPEHGSLALRLFGWDVLDALREAGFTEPEVWLFWSRELGYLGGTQVAIVARSAP